MRRLVPATGPLAGWDRDFTVGVALSTLLHAGVAFLVLWLASRAPAPPPPVESYTVELTDPAALGGRLAFGPLDRQIGRPRRIADAAGGAPAGEPRPGESPRGETVKPPKGAEPARPTRASKPLAPVKPPAAVVAAEPQLPRAAPDAVVVPPKPDAAKPPPPKATVEDVKAPPPKPVPPSQLTEPATPAAPEPKRAVRLPEPQKRKLELPRMAPEPKPQADAPVQQARATPTTLPLPEPQAAPKPEPKPEPNPTPRPPSAQTAITSDEPSPAVATEPPTPAQPSWRNAGPRPQSGPRKPPGVADGARDPSEKPMAAAPEPGAGSAPKPEPTAPAAGVEGTGTGGTAETPVQDAYAAAAERWRSRMAGAAGGMGGAPAATGAIGDGTTDSGGGGSVVGFEFLSYRQRIFGTIKSNWTNTVRTPGLVAAVRFQLAPDGGVSSIELVRSSGDRVYDQAVVRAVQRSNPLPPPPERYRDDFREVIVDFHSEEGGSGQG